MKKHDDILNPRKSVSTRSGERVEGEAKHDKDDDDDVADLCESIKIISDFT